MIDNITEQFEDDLSIDDKSGDLTPTSSSNSNSDEQQPKSKRAKRHDSSHHSLVKHTKLLPFPRILKSDIRRIYGHMFVNCFNSQDPKLYRNFYETYGIENFLFRSSCTRPSQLLQANSEDPIVELVGVEANSVYLELTFLNNPDFVVTISEPTLECKRGSLECRFVCNMQVRATFMNPVWIDKVAGESIDHVNASEDHSDGSKTISTELSSMTTGFTPIPVICNGQIHIEIDEHKRIKQVECMGETVVVSDLVNN